mgnify:CR=1 FL=1
MYKFIGWIIIVWLAAFAWTMYWGYTFGYREGLDKAFIRYEQEIRTLQKSNESLMRWKHPNEGR